MQGQGNSEHGEGIELTDAWWEALGPRALHSIRVQIIESLRWIGEPLHALELREISIYDTSRRLELWPSSIGRCVST